MSRRQAGMGQATPRAREGSSGVAVGPCHLGDQAGDGRRLGEVDGVAAGDFGGGRAGPLGHRPLCLRRDHPVVGRDQVPAWAAGELPARTDCLTHSDEAYRERSPGTPSPTKTSSPGADRALAALIRRGPSASSVHQARKLTEKPTAGIATSRTSPKRTRDASGLEDKRSPVAEQNAVLPLVTDNRC